VTQTADTTVETPQSLAARTARWAAWAVWLLTMVAATLGLLYGIAEQGTGRSVIPQSVLSYASGAAASIVYVSVGLFLRLRRPDLVIGWLFMGIGLVAGVADLTWAYTLLAAASGRSPGPLAASEVGWIANAVEAPLWWASALALLLLFPDGRPIGERWRLLTWALIPLAAALAVCLALTPGPLVFFAFLSNPHPGPSALGDLAALGVVLLTVFMAGIGAVSIRAVILRYRRGTVIEREQLKWFAWAGSILIAGGSVEIVLAGTWSPSNPAVADVAWLVFTVAALALPAAAVVAILRYRLYDIDRVIGRTFVYGALTAILAGLYAASIKLFTDFFVGVSGQSSDLALVLTTLVLATTFTPIKQRLESIAAQRFHDPGAGLVPAAAAVASTGGVAEADLDRRMEEIARRVAREMLDARAPDTVEAEPVPKDG
jgi:hypothetical protein